jgi:hypothetical protein
VRAAVFHQQPHGGPVAGGVGVDPAAGVVVADGVVDEVGGHLGQQDTVAGNLRGVAVGGGVLDVQAHAGD